MTTHNFPSAAESQTTETVLWRCRVCQIPINFSKVGFGEPTATTSTYPANIDDWMGVCLGVYVYAGRLMAKAEFMNRITSNEMGGLVSSNNQRIKGLVKKLEMSDQIEVDHPELLNDLIQARTLGILLDDNRPSEIVS